MSGLNRRLTDQIKRAERAEAAQRGLQLQARSDIAMPEEVYHCQRGCKYKEAPGLHSCSSSTDPLRFMCAVYVYPLLL